MSSLSHLYSDFGKLDARSAASPKKENAPLAEDQVADVKLAAFEEGYKAGWEDALQARDGEDERLSEALIQRFEDLSFTYQEAHSKLASAMNPLLARFVTKLLPETIGPALNAQLVHQISEMINTQSENSIEVAVSPEMKQRVEALLADRLNIPFAVAGEPALTSGQAYIRVNETEREINLDEVLKGISEAVEAFMNSNEGDAEGG